MSFDRVEANNLARREYIEEMKAIYRIREANLQGRKVEYFKNHKRDVADAVLLVGSTTAAAGVAGGVAGAIIGGTAGSPGGPPGMILGASIGAPIGVGVGLAIGTTIATIKLRPQYKDWCKTEAGKVFAGKLRIFLHEDSLLEHLTCPISMMPVMEGVRTPDGQIWEKDNIVEWVKKHGTNPMTNEKISLKDLRPDDGASLESAKLFVKFLKSKREETKEYAPDVIQGYDKLIYDIRESAMYAYNSKLVLLQQRWKNGEISYEKFYAASKSLSNKYLNI